MKTLFNVLALFSLLLLTHLHAASDDYTIGFESATYSENTGTTIVNIRVTPQNRNTYAPGDKIVIIYETQNAGGGADATAGSDYTSISSTSLQVDLDVNADGTALVFVPITILQDTLLEGDEEFLITITNASVNNSKSVAISTDGGLITIEDDDTGSLPTLSIEDKSVTEANVDLSVRVSLSSASTNDVTFSYVSVDGTATGGNDYTLVGSTATISAGSTFTNITVPILEDLVNEGDETFDMFISNPTNATVGDPQGIITILDNDVADSLSINDAAIAEGDTDKNATIKIVFSSPTLSDLAITYHTVAGSATADVDYTSITLGVAVIPAGSSDYNLSVVIKGDDINEGVENFYLLIDTVTGLNVPVLADTTSTITIFDDDSSGACSSYVGLMTLNEYQNNPHYFDGPRNDPDSKIQGNYVEIKYIDFLVKRFVTDDWSVSVLGNSGTQEILWRDRDLQCVDPRYEIFQFNNSIMAARGYVTLKDNNGNEVDVLAIDTVSGEYYAQQCQDFVYDTDFDSSAQNKDLFREPDGTGDWTDNGSGANSGGSRCINKDGGTGLLFTEFDGIDTDETPNTPIGNALDVPIKTKVVNKSFNLNILSIETGAINPGTLKDADVTIKVYLGDEYGNKLPGTNPGKDVVFSDSNTVLVQNFTYDKAVQKARLVFEYCGTDTGATDDWDTCYNTGNADDIVNQRRSNSRNQFSIRPDRFSFTSTSSHFPNLLRAGQEYNLTLYAPYYDGSDTDQSLDYNQSNANIQTNPVRYFGNGSEDTGGLLHGDLTWGATAFNMVDGISLFNGSNNVAGIQYSDVGKVLIQIQDQVWAAIDNDDTPQDCNSTSHTWICADTNATFIPHHFNVEEVHLRNHDDGGFTYLSDDLNMSAHIDVNISARNALNNITQNFHANDSTYEYYENPLSVDLNITEWLSVTSRHLKGNDTHKHDIPTEMLLGFSGGTHNIPWNESNVTQQLMFNYERLDNQTVNPFDINGTDINVTVQSTYTDPDGIQPDAIITGSGIGDRNATFYFARAKVAKANDFYDSVTTATQNTPMTIQLYCDLRFTCATWLDTINGLTDDNDWWLSVDHNEATGDGNITLISPPNKISGGSGHNPTVTTDVTVPTGSLGGIDNSVNVTRGGTSGLPMLLGVNLDTSSSTSTNSWLIYHPTTDGIGAQTPFYKVRFIGTSNWTGHGRTGHVVDSNSSTKKNNRLGW